MRTHSDSSDTSSTSSVGFLGALQLATSEKEYSDCMLNADAIAADLLEAPPDLPYEEYLVDSELFTGDRRTASFYALCDAYSVVNLACGSSVCCEVPQSMSWYPTIGPSLFVVVGFLALERRLCVVSVCGIESCIGFVF